MQNWQQVLTELVSDRLTSLKRLSGTVAAVAAIAVTVPVALGHSNAPVGQPRPPLLRLSLTVTVNGLGAQP